MYKYKCKTYKDSKEFPLENFERISSTGNFLYMIKGYDEGDETEANIDEMEALFNEVVKDYVISLNARNFDIVQHGKINASKIDLMKFILAREIIILQIKYLELGGIESENINELLINLKIQKKPDLYLQIEIIDRKIDKLQNDISEAEAKIKKNNPEEKKDESDINEIITNVELILERSIDLQKTSLYRFGIMQNQARKKIEQINKNK